MVIVKMKNGTTKESTIFYYTGGAGQLVSQPPKPAPPGKTSGKQVFYASPIKTTNRNDNNTHILK